MGTTGQSITLANSIIGVGILAMPFCFQQCGVLLATIILLSMGLVSRLCCYFLLKSALLARRRNFEFLAFHVFGSAGKLAVEVGIIGFLMGTCIAYFVVVGDLGPQIIAKMFNINQSDILRTSIMVIVSLVCVLPLGLLRNVDSLSNVSAATICFYVCLVMKVIAEAASQLLTGDWQSRVEMWKPSGVLQCVPIFSMALFCQTQLFEIFESLPTLSLEKMNLVTKNAINICTGVYFTLGLFGYIAFSAQHISGNILMSLSPTMGSDVIKLGFVMSVAFSFPLIIFPCRASLYSLLYKKVHSSHHDHIINHSIPERSFRCLTVGIVAAALFVSLLLPNIELVLGLVGSTIGVLICVVFPAACFVNVTFKNTNERVLAKAILILGLVIMVLGTFANLQAAENQVDKYDEKYITKERIDQMVEDFFQKRMESSDNVVAKPDETEKDEKTKENGEEPIKESVVLPPNPVPPESQSNEKSKKDEDIKPVSKIKESVLKPEETIDKVSETHPKNLNKLNEVKTTNGGSKPKVIEKAKEEVKVPSNEEKINMIKQQQLIETIKQHGEEQKELIKEQKEILTEIKKTKEELQKSKSEAAEADAKKIAVESIKKMADVAIQSIVGVSDKPGKIGNEDAEKLEKLADEAVQKIAQQAVETIEAIKENKEQAASQNKPAQPVLPERTNPAQNNQINQNLQPNVPQVAQNDVVSNPQSNSVNNNAQGQNNNMNHIPAVNSQPELNAQPVQNLVPPNPSIAQQIQNIVQQAQHAHPQVVPQVQNVAKPTPNVQPVQNVVPNVAQPVNPSPSVGNVPVAAGNVAQPENVPVVNQNNLGQPDPPPVIANQPQTVQNDVNPNQAAQNQANVQAQHSHSPDEPQSYKQGEDTQKKTVDQTLNNNVAKNVPLPLAINGNNQQDALNNNIVQNNGAQNGQKKENAAVRQKREVVDCTAKSSLKPEDKEICNTLIDKPGLNADVKDILASKVDLNDVALSKDIPMQENVLHHISRSLKMFDETNKEER